MKSHFFAYAAHDSSNGQSRVQERSVHRFASSAERGTHTRHDDASRGMISGWASGPVGKWTSRCTAQAVLIDAAAEGASTFQQESGKSGSHAA